LDLQHHYDEWSKSTTGIKFTKYLAHIGINNDIISKLGQTLICGKFKISCRFKDILRCAKTTHHNSCYSEDSSYRDMPAVLANDPNIAIVYVPDKRGDFILRSFVRLVKNEIGDYNLVVLGWYGNGSVDSIMKSMNGILPTFEAVHRRSHIEDSVTKILYSPVKSTLMVGDAVIDKVYNDNRVIKTKKSKIGIQVYKKICDSDIA